MKRLLTLLTFGLLLLLLNSCSKSQDYSHYKTLIVGEWQSYDETINGVQNPVQPTITYSFSETGSLILNINDGTDDIVDHRQMNYVVTDDKLQAQDLSPATGTNSPIIIRATITQLTQERLILRSVDGNKATRDTYFSRGIDSND